MFNTKILYMKKLYSLLIVVLLIHFQARSQIVPINIGTTTLETSTLLSTTEIPWELKYGPGDSLWMTTKSGLILRIHPTNGGVTTLLNHTANVWQVSESGMLGMVFHPDFANNPYIYVAYTYTNAGLNRERLSRFTYSGNALINEFVLIDGGNIVANSIHNGSRLLILPDNTLLMSTGDAANTANAQNSSSLNGKILRVNLDGTIPADNPIPGSLVYTIGHRNPQGLMLHPNGRIYSTEHGPNNNDEFQVIEAGRNYGWPNVQGFCDNDIAGETTFCTANNVKEPLASWLVAPGGTWAPNDMIWYTHPSIPEFQNSFLVTFLKTAKIRRVNIDGTGNSITGETDFFVNQWGRLRDITAAPNGDIYIATNTPPSKIIRLRNLTTVPVYMSDYRISCIQGKAQLNWTTQAEIKNRQFLIYRSTDGINYELISTLPSLAPGGTSDIPYSYSYTDNFAGAEQVLYKIVGEDLDGQRKNFEVLSSPCQNGAGDIRIIPNPATDQTLITLPNATDFFNISVLSTEGKQLFTSVAQRNLLNISVNKWPAGTYIVSIINQRSKEKINKKFVVAR
jgi:glucose/arabinose dehydrogenase